MTVLAIDQGTSSTKALVVGDDGSVVAEASRPVRPRAGADGSVEQDPAELFDSVVAAGRAALAAAAGRRVDAVGLANQGETVLCWDPTTGAPLTTALSWQDRRAVEVTDALAGRAAELTAITGLPLDPYFSAPKMAWLRRHRSTEGVVTTTDAWLLDRLCGAFATDVTTASRSLVLDLDERTWSMAALAAFGLDGEELPTVVGCATPVGHTSVFGPDLPVTGLAVDQQAALIGEGCLSAGDAKCTYGTGAFLLVDVGSRPCRSTHGLSASVAWDVPGSVAYCLDGQSYTAGAAVDWLVRLGLLSSVAAVDVVAGSVDGTGGVVVVPALAGLGAPHWAPSAVGTVEGAGLHTEAAHLVRATLEGLAVQVALMAVAGARDAGVPLRALRADGGLTASTVLMQLQADLLQVPVDVVATPHATALGVAALAELGRSDTPRSGLELPEGSLDVVARYEPSIGPDEAAERIDRFERAVARSIAAGADGAAASAVPGVPA